MGLQAHTAMVSRTDSLCHEGLQSVGINHDKATCTPHHTRVNREVQQQHLPGPQVFLLVVCSLYGHIIKKKRPSACFQN